MGFKNLVNRIKLVFKPKWAAAILLQKEIASPCNGYTKVSTTNRIILWWGYPSENISAEDVARQEIMKDPNNAGFTVEEVVARRII